MCQIGRACFEMVDFPGAATAFERARHIDPCQLEVKKTLFLPTPTESLYYLAEGLITVLAI